MKTNNLAEWLKANAFSVLNLVVILVGFAYQYGVLNTKLANLSERMGAAETDMENQKLYAAGQSDHEKRITALEKKTDDFSTIKVIVQQQSDQISKIADAISKDHEVLIRLVDRTNGQ